MSIFSNLDGTMSSSFLIGKNGVKLVFQNGALKLMNQGETTYVNAEINDLTLDGGLKLKQCQNITSLRSTEPTQSNQLISVIGYNANSKIGGGIMESVVGQDATNLEDNGITIFKTPLGSAWVRKSTNILTPADAGAACDGLINDTVSLQKIMDYCASTNTPLDLKGLKYYIVETLNYSFKRFTIIGNNATFLVEDGDSIVFNLVGHTLPGTAVSDSSAYTFGGLCLYPKSPLVIRTGRTAFSIGSSTYDCGGIASDNISISGFNIGLTFANNSYIHNFTKWKFTRCNKDIYYPTGLSNSGENINFVQCVFANSTTCIDAGGDCVINVLDSSFDYSPEKIYAHAGGIVKASNCWFEGNDDDAVWVHTLNQLSTVILDKCTFVLAGNRTKYLFEGGTPEGGIIINSPMITTTGNPTYTNTTWGTGQVSLIGTPIYRRPDVSNDTIPFSVNMGTVVSPNFNLTFTDSSRSDFSLRPTSSSSITSRNETTSLSAGVTYNSTAGYLTMQPPVGNISRITRTLVASPGATITASAYIKSVFANASDQLDLNLYFKNATGVTIAVYNKRFTSLNANATPTRVNLLRGIAAPQGTAYLMYEITTTNPAIDGNTVHQISNFNIEAGNGVINLQFDTTQSPSTGFTPYIVGQTTAGSGTYTTQVGGYTLIGNIVFVNLHVTWTGHTGTGQMRIGGLPYLTDFPSGEIMNVMSSGITTTGTLLGVMEAYSNSMIINQQAITGGLSSLQMTTSGSIQVTGIYRRC